MVVKKMRKTIGVMLDSNNETEYVIVDVIIIDSGLRITVRRERKTSKMVVSSQWIVI